MDRLAISLGLLAAAPHGSAIAQSPFWTWNGKDTEGHAIDIDLVRGSVKVLRREGPVEVVVVRTIGSGRADAVRIIVADIDGIIRIRDQYPPPPRWQWGECLPPIDDRGDYWRNSVRFETIVWAPSAAHVSARVKDGIVEGADQ